jgi:y4mF family transcriptional regulator
MRLKEFVKEKRRSVNLTQLEMAEKAGVGLRFVREMEQGKETLRMDKVNQVLKLFGYELMPAEMKRDIVLIESDNIKSSNNDINPTQKKNNK